MPISALLAAVAAHGLAGSRTDLPARPLGELEWFDLVQGCVATGLVGFLAAAAADGHLPLTDGQADELAIIEREHAALSLLVERQAVTVAAVLTAAGIEHRVIDGPARRVAYGESGVRHVRSVQVLVAPDRLVDALALRPGSAGTERVTLVSSLPGFGALGADRPDEALDAATAPPAAPDLVDRLGAAVVVPLAGRDVAALSLEQQLVVACVELVAAPVTSLAQLRDVAQLALCPALDALRARRLAESIGASGMLADGLAMAWHRFDLADKTELSVWALRVAGHRHGPRAGSTSPGRVGLARRVLGRRPSAVPTGTPRGRLPQTPRPTTPNPTPTSLAGERIPGATRRQR